MSLRLYVPLVEPAYGTSDCIVLEVKYRKSPNPNRCAYCVDVRPGGITGSGFFVEYCAEYYTYYGTMTSELVPSSRRSQKREKAAEEILRRDAMLFVERYLNDVAARGGKALIPQAKPMERDELIAFRSNLNSLLNRNFVKYNI